MKNLIKKLMSDSKERLNTAINIIHNSQEFPALHKALSVDNQVCYNIFNIGNNTVENVLQLSAMFSNCLLDDSSFKIERKEHEKVWEGSDPFYTYTLVWGNGDKRSITSEEVIEVLNIGQNQHDFYYENKDSIEKNHWCDEYMAYFDIGKKQRNLLAHLWDLQEKEGY